MFVVLPSAVLHPPSTILPLLLLLLGAFTASAATRYVWQSSPSPAPPYTNWTTAAHVLQDAVDAAQTGDEIVVTNGTYAAGGRAVVGTLTNRVAVDRPLTLRSVNGPRYTVIQGYQVPGTTNGDGAIRCAYLTNGASLSGFTLTNGATRSAGDSRDQSGGGVYGGTLNNCTLTGNSAQRLGGGASGDFSGWDFVPVVLNHCTLTRNSAGDSGGGAAVSTLNHCTLSGNSATVKGGGGYESTLNHCTLAGNSAAGGGGASSSTLNNCLLRGNSARDGGGAFVCTLNHCTLTGNSGGETSGGAYLSKLTNCIVYFNTATFYGENYSSCSLSYCCTTPDPGGDGNLTLDPLFLDLAGSNLRLQPNSPCINAGTNDYAPGSTDLDGRPRIVGSIVDIGAYEFQPGVSGQFIAWLQHYGLPTEGSADATDPDADGHTTWQEWRCLTDPTNALSVLRLLTASPAGTNVTVSWQSVAGVNYSLERGTDLSATPPFTLLAANLPGQPGTTSYTDTNAPVAPRLFYRVGVGL